LTIGKVHGPRCGISQNFQRSGPGNRCQEIERPAGRYTAGNFEIQDFQGYDSSGIHSDVHGMQVLIPEGINKILTRV